MEPQSPSSQEEKKPDVQGLRFASCEVGDDHYHIDQIVPKKIWGVSMKDGYCVLYLPLKHMKHITARGVIDYIRDKVLGWYSDQELLKLKSEMEAEELRQKLVAGPSKAEIDKGIGRA